MNTLEAIYKRRAVKHFDPEHKLTEEEEKKLPEATIQAPTSFHIRHWRFVILRGQAGSSPSSTMPDLPSRPGIR